MCIIAVWMHTWPRRQFGAFSSCTKLHNVHLLYTGESLTVQPDNKILWWWIPYQQSIVNKLDYLNWYRNLEYISLTVISDSLGSQPGKFRIVSQISSNTSSILRLLGRFTTFSEVEIHRSNLLLRSASKVSGGSDADRCLLTWVVGKYSVSRMSVGRFWLIARRVRFPVSTLLPDSELVTSGYNDFTNVWSVSSKLRRDVEMFKEFLWSASTSIHERWREETSKTQFS